MNDADKVNVLPAPEEKSDKRVIFIGLGNRLPADPIFDPVFRFLGIDRRNITVFTRVSGGLEDFLRLLNTYPNSFSRAILLFSADGDIAVPDGLHRLELPIPWEAFRIFASGNFSRIPEKDEESSTSLPLEKLTEWQDAFA